MHTVVVAPVGEDGQLSGDDARPIGAADTLDAALRLVVADGYTPHPDAAHHLTHDGRWLVTVQSKYYYVCIEGAEVVVYQDDWSRPSREVERVPGGLVEARIAAVSWGTRARPLPVYTLLDDGRLQLVMVQP